MDRKHALELLELLSALEAWSFSTEKQLPDFLFERLDSNISKLRDCVLDEKV